MRDAKPFNPRSDALKARDEPGKGDDLPCVKCGAKALDTGLECSECGHDNYEAVTGRPFGGKPSPVAEPASTWRAPDRTGMRYPEQSDLSGGATDCAPAPTVDERTANSDSVDLAAASNGSPGGAGGVTVLPDGSAFSVVSFPLPKDHWLYAPLAAWDSERDDMADTPHPILTNAQREAVVAAARYAIRGATMRGQEPDFDPDALVQNFCYALCGPARGAVLPADRSAATSPEADAPNQSNQSGVN